MHHALFSSSSWSWSKGCESSSDIGPELIGMSQQQYQRVESGQDLKVSTLLRILAGLDLELAVVDPSDVDGKSTTPANSETESIWASKHKHLED